MHKSNNKWATKNIERDGKRPNRDEHTHSCNESLFIFSLVFVK